MRHVGSAHDEVTLAMLLQEADGLIVDDAQMQLDLGLHSTGRHVALLPEPTAPELLPEPPAPRGRPARHPRVTRSLSGLLYEVLAGVFDDLGFDVVADGAFRDLVIARVTALAEFPQSCSVKFLRSRG